MTKEELRALTEELFRDMEDIKIRLGRIGKFDPSAVLEVYAIMQEVIHKIEEYSTDIKPISGEDKKGVAVLMLNGIVDIPWVPEFVESALISWSIDLVVNVFNSIGGKSWLETLFAEKEIV